MAYFMIASVGALVTGQNADRNEASCEPNSMRKTTDLAIMRSESCVQLDVNIIIASGHVQVALSDILLPMYDTRMHRLPWLVSQQRESGKAQGTYLSQSTRLSFPLE